MGNVYIFLEFVKIKKKVLLILLKVFAPIIAQKQVKKGRRCGRVKKRDIMFVKKCGDFRQNTSGHIDKKYTE